MGGVCVQVGEDAMATVGLSVGGASDVAVGVGVFVSSGTIARGAERDGGVITIPSKGRRRRARIASS